MITHLINFLNQYVLLNIFVKSWNELYIYILNMKKVKKYIHLKWPKW